ncbi:hypothetical protein GEMMAAP_18010 [Gemmatimonas phototrophica]|uniref:TonB-dependent receptor plug domain-containing protein n=2 Tax=Gemmatimonas phototrophica TaxID=1379270 RepID=A0A143BM93_9BACT|nr:hypothetical protein GEMMAAP_18010 [Gemmatimonas phototrophica]
MTLGVGAALLAATVAGRVHAQPAARLRGVVFDSVARAPLADAAVRVFRSNQAADGFDARTDSQGGFSVPVLPAGTWLVSFLHPRLDALRIEAPLAQVQVVEAGTITLTLAIPGAATLARRLCGVPPEDSLAVVTGDVRDATQRRPVAGAMVRASWPEWVFANKKMGREDAVREARADSTGQFVLCHVPQNSIVTALAYLGADTTGVIELSVPTAEYVVADFVLDRTATGAPTRERRGAGTVRGVVTTPNGQPLVNAVARVLGSGSPARSDSAGRFRVADAVAGTQTLEVRSVGFEPQRIPVVLRAGEVANVAIALASSGTRIDTVRVTAGRVVPWQVERIEARWKQGLGVIMDGATIRERTSTTLTTALWNVPGVRLGNRLGSGNTIIMRGQNGRECFPRIFLDGYSISRGITATTARNPNLDGFVELSLDEIVTPGDVLAMEVYDNPMKVPPEFFSGGDCGVVLVWTGYALKKVAPIDPRRRQ